MKNGIILKKNPHGSGKTHNIVEWSRSNKGRWIGFAVQCHEGCNSVELLFLVDVRVSAQQQILFDHSRQAGHE